MNFFANMTVLKSAGLILLAAGAAINFLAVKIAAKINTENKFMPVIIKTVGLGIVITGFIMIMVQ